MSSQRPPSNAKNGPAVQASASGKPPQNASLSEAGEPSKNSALQIAIQIGAGLVVIVVLYIITLIVLNIDSIVISSNSAVKPKQKTSIIDGYASVSYLTNKSYNTVTPHASMFKKIGKSINTEGGAQFTYQMWVKIENADDSLFEELILVLKGDKRKFKVGYYSDPAETGTYSLKETVSAHAIAAPLIKFTNSYRNLRVTMNTVNNPLVNIDINMNATPGVGRQNLLSLMAMNSWFLLTFVFVDSFSTPRAAEDGIKFIFYVNDIPYMEHTGNSLPELKNNALRQNEGNLYLFPDNAKSGEFMKIGNLNYFNYALTPKDVQKAFEMGPPTHSAVLNAERRDQPAMLSAYNKIDMTNF